MRWRLAVLLLLAQPFSGWAHGPWVGPGADNVARVLVRVFDQDPAFTAKASCHMESPHPGEYLDWTLDLAWRGGVLRSEVDSAAMRGVPPRAATDVDRDRSMGIARSALILRSGEPRVYVYPEARAYAVEPAFPRDSATAVRRAAGQEQRDGIDCTKYTIAMPADNEWGIEDVVLWTRADAGTPVCLQCRTEDGAITMHFTDVKTGAADETLFAPPAGFERHESILDLVRAAGTRYYAQPHGP